MSERLTREEIEKLRDSKYPWAQLGKLIHGLPSNSDAPDAAISYLCDLALSALDREADLGGVVSARNEVLEEAAQAIEDWHEEPDDAWAERQIASGLAARIRALKREPNAAAQAQTADKDRA